MAGLLTPYAMSNFALHSLTPTVGIMSSIIGGVSKLTLAKRILDVFGRPHGYLISVLFATLGLLMMVATKSVEMFAAAQVFYWVGMNVIAYAIMGCSCRHAVTQQPWPGYRFFKVAIHHHHLAQRPHCRSLLQGPCRRHPLGSRILLGFRRIFRHDACCYTTLFVLFVFNLRKAVKLGVITKTKSNRNPLQSFIYNCREIDIGGLFLISAGLSIFLLPFNICSFQA